MPRTESPALEGGNPIQMQTFDVGVPFARVHDLEHWSKNRFVWAFLLALGAHLAVGSRGILGLDEIGDFARLVQSGMQARIRPAVEVDVQPEPEPEPEPEPPPPEPEPEPAPEPVKPPPQKALPAPAPKEAPAPTAAQAGKVLTAEPTPDEPLDLTGDAFVQGNADFYAGGITASKGTSTQAVRNPAARAEGVVGGTGTAPAGEDRSRAAGTTVKNWDCPFPAEADLEQINYQQVRVAVTVSPQGKALEVKVIGDTSFGFGRAAQRCALGKPFIPALDRGGNAITTTIPIVVTFVRR
ncbi:MAG TPA: hypothetical protein VMG12_17455 [Polyangiaceae bacterium]|nr:hypothetical protein [Polyangiaceae bacterium]